MVWRRRTLGGGRPATATAPPQYPPTQIINGVTYKHVGSGVYEDPITGEVGRIYTKSGSGFSVDNQGNLIPNTGGLTFDALPSDFQPWNAKTGSGSSSLSDDPRYWDLEYKKLYQDALNMGLDSEAARRQAQASLIMNRNNASVDLASASTNAAKIAADFAANPRDAVAENLFRGAAVGNAGTPFGNAMSDPNFPKYQSALEDKFQQMFGGVAGDFAKARDFVSSIPPREYLSPEDRASIGLPAVPQGVVPGGGTVGTSLPAVAPAGANPLAQLGQGLNSLSPEDAYRFRQYTSPDFFKKNPGAYAGATGLSMGGSVSVNPEDPGYTPTSSEGGVNVNIFEPSVIMGVDSGHIYAKLAEPRPDGKRRGEQVIVKPLKSETAKDKKYEASQGSAVAQGFPAPGMAHGGTANIVPNASDLINGINTSLRGLGGAHGGVGNYSSVGTPLPDPRMLAGAPWEALQQDPDLLDQSYSAYSHFGISPRQLESTVRKFTPQAPINNFPRVSWA